MKSTINIILTGATGMVGEGVLQTALQHPAIGTVLVITRRPSGLQHPKLKEVIHQDFGNLQAIEASLTGYDACLFCLGTTSVGKSQEDYFKTTYTLTMHVAETLSRLNTDMTFCYISGAGTDSKESSRLHWARVKGKTENDLQQLPFKAVYNFRPGFIRPMKGQRNILPVYKYIGWIFPIGRALSPGGFCKVEELGRAMIHAAQKGYPKHILEGKDIIQSS
ncbi:MAG: NAD(P)H-binding protein [Candidatus Pseudobacter hemicellulosilyticus]|uniref:NAD(P)H-binding protein n=1 Tax=Candidatus Pseudobacter hemicellulosilyticus TaxID=3121375 RepID=A0AAJ5WR24_9BACT|nr:MAG: NAD(P)H-binding protein [Pseudobacter sp.]